jgi:hypothetical protein
MLTTSTRPSSHSIIRPTIISCDGTFHGPFCVPQQFFAPCSCEKHLSYTSHHHGVYTLLLEALKSRPNTTSQPQTGRLLHMRAASQHTLRSHAQQHRAVQHCASCCATQQPCTSKLSWPRAHGPCARDALIHLHTSPPSQLK